MLNRISLYPTLESPYTLTDIGVSLSLTEVTL